MAQTYAVLVPTFWTGETGKQLRAAGRDAQVVALYLVTGPPANMIGLYYLALPTLMHEVGISEEGASKALRRLSEGAFAYYDEPSEYVYVPEMARFQVGATLGVGDKRIKWISRTLDESRKCPFAQAFYEKYRKAYHLPLMQFEKPLRSPFEAPSKPLRSPDPPPDPDPQPENPLPRTAARREVSKALKATDPRVRPVLDAFCAEHQRTLGSDYVVAGARDAQAIRRLPASYDTAQLLRLIVSYFAEREARQQYGATVSQFVTRAPILASRSPQPPQPMVDLVAQAAAARRRAAEE